MDQVILFDSTTQDEAIYSEQHQELSGAAVRHASPAGHGRLRRHFLRLGSESDRFFLEMFDEEVLRAGWSAV